MKTCKYFCDRCGTEVNVKNSLTLWTISIEEFEVNEEGFFSSRNVKTDFRNELCPNCGKALNLLIKTFFKED